MQSVQSRGSQKFLHGLSHCKELLRSFAEGICANIRSLSLRGHRETEKLSGALQLSVPLDATFICKASSCRYLLLFAHLYFITFKQNPEEKRSPTGNLFCRGSQQVQWEPHLSHTWNRNALMNSYRRLQKNFLRTHAHIPCPGEEALINLLIKLKLFALSYHTRSSLSLFPAGSSSECLVLQLLLQYSPKGLREWGEHWRTEANSSLQQW